MGFILATGKGSFGLAPWQEVFHKAEISLGGSRDSHGSRESWNCLEAAAAKRFPGHPNPVLKWENLVKRTFFIHILAWEGICRDILPLLVWLRNLSPLELWEGGTGSALDGSHWMWDHKIPRFRFGRTLQLIPFHLLLGLLQPLAWDTPRNGNSGAIQLLREFFWGNWCYFGMSRRKFGTEVSSPSLGHPATCASLAPGAVLGPGLGTVEQHSRGCAQPGITTGIPQGSGLPSLCWNRGRQVTGAPCRD